MAVVLLDVGIMAVALVLGNILFRRFEQRAPLWRRFAKAFAALGITAAVSYFFGRTGVIIWFAAAALPVVYIHAIYLPRHGVNGWTGEPKEKYYALRGWPPPEQ